MIKAMVTYSWRFHSPPNHFLRLKGLASNLGNHHNQSRKFADFNPKLA